MVIKPKIESLLDSINEITGEERETLTDAVQDLVDGQGDNSPLMSYGASSSGISKLQVADNMWLQTGESYAQFKMLIGENTNFIFNPTLAQKSLRVIIRAKPTVVNSGYPYVTGTSSWQKGVNFQISNDSTVWLKLSDNNGTTRSVYAGTISANTWYYFCLYYDVASKILYGSTYDDNGSLLSADFYLMTGVINNTSYYQKLGGECYSDNCFKGYIDIKSVLFEMDDTAVWGKETEMMKNMGIFSIPTASEITWDDVVEVESIRGTLGYNITPTSHFDEFFANLNASDNSDYMFASRNPNDIRLAKFKETWSPYPSNFSFNGTWTNTWGNPSLNTEYDVYIKMKNGQQEYWINDSLIQSGSYTITDSVPLTSFQLLCADLSGTNQPFKGTVKGRTVFKYNGEKVYEFAPVRIKDTIFSKLGGMYDVINDKFYYSILLNNRPTFGADVNPTI